MNKTLRRLLLCLVFPAAISAPADVVRFDDIEFDASAWGAASMEIAEGRIKVVPARGTPGDTTWSNVVIVLEPAIQWDRLQAIRMKIAGDAVFDVRVRFASDASRGFVPSLLVDKYQATPEGIAVDIPAGLLRSHLEAGDPPDAIVLGVGTDLGNTARKSRIEVTRIEAAGGGLKPPAFESARSTEEWLDAMQDPVTGLVRSYDSQWNSFAYDQGAWALAQCALGKREPVKKLFQALRKLQESNGLIRAGYHWKTGRVVFEQPSPGQMAWIGMALNAYAMRFDDREFVPMAEKLGDYMISQQDADGGIVGVDGNVPWDKDGEFREVVLWKSTEETMDAFSFLHYLGVLTQKEKYKETAQKARRFVESMWDEGHGLFCQGIQRGKHETQFRRDLRFPGDVQYWVIMAIGPKGFGGQNYTKALDLVEKKLAVKDGDLRGISYSEEYGRQYPGCIWWDQTLSLAAAFGSIGDQARRQQHLDDAAKAKSLRGAFALTTSGRVKKPEWPLMPHASVAATSWYVFASRGFNPFHPEKATQ